MGGARNLKLMGGRTQEVIHFFVLAKCWRYSVMCIKKTDWSGSNRSKPLWSWNTFSFWTL